MKKLSRTPLHRQIRDILAEELRSKYAVGDFLPGETHLAERFDVSVLTVREALQGLVAGGFLERLRGKGTRVLSTQKIAKEGHVGILIDLDVSHPNISPNYLRIASALRQELEAGNLATRFYLGTLQPGEARDSLTCREVMEAAHKGTLTALIVLQWTTADLEQYFEKLGVPVVRMGQTGQYRVVIDTHRFIRQAAEGLIESGCRKIAMMSWNGLDRARAFERTEFLQGYLKQRGLECHQEWVRGEVSPNLTGAGWEEFRGIWNAHPEKPDGLIITDEGMLKDALMAIHEMGVKLPRQLQLAFSMLSGTAPKGLPCGHRYLVPLPQIVENLVELVTKRIAGIAIDCPVRVISPTRSAEAAPAAKKVLVTGNG